MTVFANGLEVACKAQANKVIAAFPDVCFTPPENPATPPGVPVPYPSFGFDSDTDKGTSTVKIGGKTITQKNKSYYTRTTGTEAGCAAKKGVVSSKNTGKEYAEAWSSDVKMDGEPISRFTDVSTNNHASPVGNAPPWPKIGELSIGNEDCASILAKVGMKVHAYRHASKECERKNKDGAPNPAYQQSDHIIQNACFVDSREAKNGISTVSDYYYKDAPCVCLEDATDTNTQHGRKTQAQNEWTATQKAAGENPTYAEAREGNLNAMKKAKPELDNEPGEPEHPAIQCLRMVCDAYFLPMMDEETGENTQVRTPHGGEFKPDLTGGSVSV